MEALKTFELENNRVLKIYQDESPESPREWDNLGEMVCFHRRYNLGDKHGYNSPEEFKESIEKGDIYLPIYMYDHSGITISTTPFSDSWDSGQVGYIIARKDKIKEEFPNPRGRKDKVLRILQAEIEVYDTFLRGEVYGFAIETTNTCDKCNSIHSETEDSCWGFYGDDWKTNGILENLDEKSRESILKQL
jgi:hypothetical protein